MKDAPVAITFALALALAGAGLSLALTDAPPHRLPIEQHWPADYAPPVHAVTFATGWSCQIGGETVGQVDGVPKVWTVCRHPSGAVESGLGIRGDRLP